MLVYPARASKLARPWLSFRHAMLTPSRQEPKAVLNYPQFHIGPIGVQLQQGPKLPPL
jgi:hypothetical protein